jgi:hypothetical protein
MNKLHGSVMFLYVKPKYERKVDILSFVSPQVTDVIILGQAGEIPLRNPSHSSCQQRQANLLLTA